MIGKAFTPNFKRLLSAVIIILSAASCVQQDAAEEHFRSHGMTYPVDVSGLGVMGVESVGIEEDEMSEPGAREYIEGGIASVKEYFSVRSASILVPGASALSLSDPILFRDGSGGVGLMVKVTIYGSTAPENELIQDIEWLDPGKKLWRAENFAYFDPTGYSSWQFAGWVYHSDLLN